MLSLIMEDLTAKNVFGYTVDAAGTIQLQGK
jgi:hypothetical protein